MFNTEELQFINQTFDQVPLRGPLQKRTAASIQEKIQQVLPEVARDEFREQLRSAETLPTDGS